jgi:Lar family restriction alleviation protein
MNPQNYGTLKPCPFCGGEAAHATCTITRARDSQGNNGTFTGYYINCILCGADNRGIAEGYRTPEQAAEKWNRRTDQSQPEGRPENDAAMKALRACHAWHIAEQQGLGSFQARMELCNYSEYMVERVLLGGDKPYEGVPRIRLFPVELVRDSAERCERLVAEVFAQLCATKRSDE